MEVKMLIGLAIVISCFSVKLIAQDDFNINKTLTTKQQNLIPIAAFTAKGELQYLQTALNDGLDAGLTINEIKEVFLQLYAYTGFPRSLNALNTFMSVLKEREQKDIKDIVGNEANPLPNTKSRLILGTQIQTQLIGKPASGAVYKFAPAIDIFLKEHLFADIFGRGLLDYQTREIVTISALASLTGTGAQLQGHLMIGKNIGLSEKQLREIAFTLSTKIGWQEGNAINKILDKIGNATTTSSIIQLNGITIQKVTFPNRNITVVGNLHFPKDFDKNKKYPAVLIGHPAGGVKEQTAGHYAELLAEKGFITLTFDASYQGESGGEPRCLEDPSVRVEDFRAATDFLSLHPSIDADRIGVLGICAGGGFAINAAQTEHRLKAVATVSMVDLGQLRRDGLNGMLKSQIQSRLDEVAKQRIKETNGEPLRYNNYVPNTLEEIPGNAPVMYREGYEYYRVTHAHPNAPNKYLFTSLDKLMNFTALDHVELISPRPLLVIAGSEADSYYFSQEAYDKAKEPKEIFKIDAASHMDLYYVPGYVEQVVNKLTEFYNKNL